TSRLASFQPTEESGWKPNLPMELATEYNQPIHESERSVSALEFKIHIIGVGSDGLAGLTARARELLTHADLVIGADQALNLLPQLTARKLRIGADLPEAVRIVEAELKPSRRVVIVAQGDPLFYGVARYLCDKLGKDRFEVLPHVSSMQLAFARIKE